MPHPDLAQWLEALHHDDEAVRATAEAAIQQAGDSILDDVIAAFQAGDLRTRVDAGIALRVLANPATIPVLQAALKDPESPIRNVAVTALFAIGEPAIPALYSGLFTNANMIGQVENALAKLGDPAIKAILPQLKQPSLNVRVRIALVITAYARQVHKRPIEIIKEATQALIAIGDDPDRDVSQFVCQAFEYLRQPEAIPLLLRWLRDTKHSVYVSAGMALGQLGEAAIPGLREAYYEEDWRVRLSVVGALGDIGGEDANQMLQDALRDEIMLVRQDACKELARSRDPRFILDFIRVIENASSYIELEGAGRALVHYADPATEPLLSATL